MWRLQPVWQASWGYRFHEHEIRCACPVEKIAKGNIEPPCVQESKREPARKGGSMGGVEAGIR